MDKKVCLQCGNYSPDDTWRPGGFGSCSLMGDVNAIRDLDTDFPRDRAMGWDCESYSAGVYVGENFGCIHWTKKSG